MTAPPQTTDNSTSWFQPVAGRHRPRRSYRDRKIEDRCQRSAGQKTWKALTEPGIGLSPEGMEWNKWRTMEGMDGGHRMKEASDQW